ncbi:thiolase family protein [Streptomyces sp. NPDC002623]
MQKIAIAGTGMTPFGLFPDVSSAELAQRAVAAALADAQCTPADIGFVAYANATDAMAGQHSIRGEVALRHTGLLGRPMVNVENACASGSSAFRLACNEIASGSTDIALVVGAEKMSYPDKVAVLGSIASGTDVKDIDRLRERLGGNPRGSIFMDIYAASARSMVEEQGVTPEDFAAVAVKSRTAGALNPNAQFRTPTTVDEVLSMRSVAGPLTLPMCSPIGDGAAALVLMSPEAARKRGMDPVFVRASILLTGLDEQDGPLVAERAARAAYEQAGIGPEEVHVAEVHDATASAEIALYEELGFCAPGDGVKLLRSGDTQINGRIAVNSGGGLLSRGHPIAATGCAQLVELSDQLRGRAGARQREGATVAIAENGGGWLGNDSAVAVVTILSR